MWTRLQPLSPPFPHPLKMGPRSRVFWPVFYPRGFSRSPAVTDLHIFSTRNATVAGSGVLKLLFYLEDVIRNC